jgi:hypothetical protein
MKRVLLALAAAVVLLNVVAVTNVARADGPGQGPPPNCAPGQVCKP